jgi:hypothetical protein
MKLAAFCRIGMVSLLAPLLSGCLTASLWTDGRFDEFREPATAPKLRLHQSAHRDVLVQYDEVNSDGPARQTRAYWLVANNEPQRNPHRPRFVSPHATPALTPIPIFPTAPTNATDQPFALSATGSTGFILYATNAAPVQVDLPVYKTMTGNFKRVLLTPFAVAGDVSIVAGVLGLWYWSSAAPNCNYD